MRSGRGLSRSVRPSAWSVPNGLSSLRGSMTVAVRRAVGLVGAARGRDLPTGDLQGTVGDPFGLLGRDDTFDDQPALRPVVVALFGRQQHRGPPVLRLSPFAPGLAGAVDRSRLGPARVPRTAAHARGRRRSRGPGRATAERGIPPAMHIAASARGRSPRLIAAYAPMCIGRKRWTRSPGSRRGAYTSR